MKTRGLLCLCSPLCMTFVPLDPIVLVLNDRLRVQHGKVWVLDPLERETSGHRERFEKNPEGKRQNGFAEYQEDLIVVELGFWGCPFKA